MKFEAIGYYLASGLIDVGSYSGDNYPLVIFFLYSIFGRVPFLIIGINGVLSILSAFFLYKSLLLVTQLSHTEI